MIQAATTNVPDRSQWGALLAGLPEPRVTGLAGRLLSIGDWQLDPVTREGLRLLPLRESTRGEMFYLGEIPLVEAHVTLQNPEGLMLQGGAALLDGSKDLVEAIAVLDAFLAGDLDPVGEIVGLLREGQAVREDVEKQRAFMRSRTKVNFSLLSEADGEERI